MSSNGRVLAFAVASVVLVLARASAAMAYEFSAGSAAACPACTTQVGEAQAAELAEGLSINGVESPKFGSTTALAEDAAATSTDARGGVARVATSLLQTNAVDALASSPFKVGGLVVGAFATGYAIGTAGRAIVMHFSGGQENSFGQVDGSSWTNARWVLCTENPCVTNLNSSAWSSPIIPFGSIYARFDHTWPNSNVSFEGVHTYIRCYGATPPEAPCQPYYYGAVGPQAGDLPGARPVTVYGVGVNERPGHVFVRRLQDLLDENAPPSIVSGDNVSGAYYGSVPQSPPRSGDDVLSALDDAVAAYPGFGPWIQSQLRLPVSECTGVTEQSCVARLRDGGFTGTITPETLSQDDAIVEQSAGRVTATSPASGSEVVADSAVTVYVNPTTMPEMTATETAIAEALKANNPEQVNETNKRTLARQCERHVTSPGSGRTGVDCMSPSLPIYVIGREWPEAADHTVRGLAYHSPWVRLTYNNVSRTSWYYSYPETDGGAASCRGTGTTSMSTACDEWPWQKTEQGGPSAFPTPHLKIINFGQNSASGNRYGRFVTDCQLAARKALPTPLNGGGNFLVIPFPTGAPSLAPSLSLCHGTNP